MLGVLYKHFTFETYNIRIVGCSWCEVRMAEFEVRRSLCN